MNDNEFSFSGWLKGHTLRQIREQIAAGKKDIQDNGDYQLKVAYVLVYFAEAATELFDGLDTHHFMKDVQERIARANKSLRERHELYSQELGQDMEVLESLGEDSPEIGGRFTEIRRALDDVREMIRSLVKENEAKPISKKTGIINSDKK